MKKKLIIVLVIFSLFILSACGKTHNAEIVKKLNSSINQIEKKISSIKEADENDFLSSELLTFTHVQASFFYNMTQKNKDDEFVSAKLDDEYENKKKQEKSKQEKSEDLAGLDTDNNKNNSQRQKSNVNTYFQNRLPRNVNTYFLPPHMPYGYGGFGGAGYGGFGGAGYGGFGYGGTGYGTNDGMANNYNGQSIGLNQEEYDNTSRREANINTYGLGASNVNSYRKSKQKNSSITENKNIENTQTNLNKLSAVYSSASHLVNINASVAEAKDRISYIIATLKEGVKQLENSKYELTSQQVKSIEILIENMNSYLSKIELSKNQLKYEVGKIKAIKDSFLSNNNELSARYIMLANFLDTRYSYYSNISNCLQEILYKISQQEFFIENNTINLNHNYKDEEFENKSEDKENVVINNSEINVENIIVEKEKTLQEQLEDSWKENFKRQQKENTLDKNAIKNEDLLGQKADFNAELKNKNQTKKADNSAESKNFKNGFKALHTEKKEVCAENIVTASTNFMPNAIFKNLDDEEIKKHLPSHFPFTKPRKQDYLSVLMLAR